MNSSYQIMQNMHVIMPEIAVALFALWALVYGAFKKRQAFRTITVCSCAFLIGLAACLMLFFSEYSAPTTAFDSLYIQDSFSLVLKIIIALGCFVSLIFMYYDMKETGIARFEAPVLVMLSMLGMYFMVSSYNFLTLYVGLELQSLALYILAAFNRNSSRAPEAGMKYFILGALASGMMLFGISFVYGFAGHTGFDVIANVLNNSADAHAGVIVGLALILAGLAFKLSAVPFHMWTPDVYQGAPASVTAFFAMVPKIAAMALLIRLLGSAFGNMQAEWVQIIYFLAAASMVLGALAGLVQKNIRRLLAYSAIGHMGYALMGVVAFGAEGVASVIIYLVIYAVMSMGVFGVILSLRQNSVSVEDIEELSGLSKTKPFHAYVMAIMMFSMAGIPPLAGFFGKLVVFNAAVSAGYISLALIGVITSVIAAYYYLRIIKVMFFDEADPAQADLSALQARPMRLSLMIAAALVTLFGLAPNLLFELSDGLVQALSL